MWTLVSLLVGCSGGGDAPTPVPSDSDTSVPTDTAAPQDLDGDGFSVADGDCDDTDPTIFPGAEERCDGIDSDCDGVAELDEDGDGYFACEDCDDTDPSVYPGAPDPLNGVDNDCDGTDGVGHNSDVVLLGTTPCGELGFSLDVVDHDGDGIDEIVAGAPRLAPCDNGTWAEAVLLAPSGAIDSVRGRFSDGLAGWRVDGFHAGGPRAAVLHVGWMPGGVVDVYTLDGGGFGSEPVLQIEGTATDYLGGVTAIGEPAEWLAVTAIASTSFLDEAYIGLFPADATGQRMIHEAPELIISTNHNYATGQGLRDVGDRDGDGLNELAVNAEYGDGIDPLDRAYVVTPGIDAILEEGLETWWGAERGLDTGALIRGGDIDGDGLSELGVSSPYAYDRRGAVHLLGWNGPGDHSLFDEAMAVVVGEFELDIMRGHVIGDADGDGIGDVVVGGQQDWASHTPGKVMLFLGPLQGTLTRADAARVWVGTDPGSRFGWALAAGDFDGNGVLDLAVSAPNQDDGDVQDVGAIHFIFDYGQ